MAETEHKSFFRTHKVLVFLPLALLGAVVWVYVSGRAGRARTAAGEDRSAAAAFRPAVLPGVARGKAAARLPDIYDPMAVIEIQGSPGFKSQVTHALRLIWLADRADFLFLKNNLYAIRNENKTDFYMDNGRPVAALSSAHAFRSLTWCGGVIAHQAWHAWYTLNGRKKIRTVPPPPGEKWRRELNVNPARVDYKGMNAILYIEDKASSFQLGVLRKTGAPKKELDLVLLRARRDFSSAHDGNYALNP